MPLPPSRANRTILVGVHDDPEIIIQPGEVLDIVFDFSNVLPANLAITSVTEIAPSAGTVQEVIFTDTTVTVYLDAGAMVHKDRTILSTQANVADTYSTLPDLEIIGECNILCKNL